MAYDEPESKKKRPRIAFTGEEYGFGYQAVNAFLADARENGVNDGGRWIVARKRIERDVLSNHARKTFDLNAEVRQPLRTKEQALFAVKTSTADFAVIPFYHPYSGYDFEALRALESQLTLMGIEQYEASDRLCLAVHESQVLDIAQSAHPGSGLSTLLKNKRKHWDFGDSVRPEAGYVDNNSSHEQFQAGLVVDRAAQLMLRDRLDIIFAGPDEARRAKSKLDGFKAAGVDVSETPRSVEPHRDLAKRARASLNTNRTTNTYFDPRSGDAHYISSMGSESASSQQLFGVVLPFQVAMMSNEYIIVDPDIEDDAPLKSRFMVISQGYDHTLYDDAYRTTDAKTRYWFRRLCGVLDGDEGRNPPTGVRVLFRFRRDGTAASIGDVEDFLRNYGVRHSVVRIDEDSERDAPSSIVLDVEFDAKDFDHNLLTMFTRRFRGSVANGAVKKAFQRWKNRGVRVLAAMPYETAQLPKHKQRRWWNEAVGAWAADITETMFIRFSRVLLVYLLPAAILVLIMLAAWQNLPR